MTAAHCLYHRGLGRVVPAGAVHLLFGYVSEAFTLHVVADAVVLAPGWEPGAREVRGDDVALLHLPSPAPAVLRPVVGRLPAGTVVEAGGYGQDRGQRLMIDPGLSGDGVCGGAGGHGAGAWVCGDPGDERGPGCGADSGEVGVGGGDRGGGAGRGGRGCRTGGDGGPAYERASRHQVKSPERTRTRMPVDSQGPTVSPQRSQPMTTV